MEIISHGTRIVRDYRKQKFLGKVKSFFSAAFWKGALGLSIVVFTFAGFISANALLGFIL